MSLVVLGLCSKPKYQELTLESGKTYRVISVGRSADGRETATTLSFLARSGDSSEMSADVDDLAEIAIPLAIHNNDSVLVLVPTVQSKHLPFLTGRRYYFRFRRQPNGNWLRVAP